MGDKMITIKTISEMAGVSVATVSRVINQNGRFSKETEERILSIIRDSGYQPNELARGLRTNKAKVVGVVVPDITNDFFARITLEIQKNLLKEDYVSIICNTDESREMEGIHYNALRTQRICGMIVAGQGVSENNKPDVPTVYVDRWIPPKESDKEKKLIVCSDNRRGGYLATRELLEKGCRNVCIVCFSKNPVKENLRFLGYTDALKEAGISVKEENIYATAYGDKDTGYEVTRRILSRGDSVDGIFYSTDFMAFGGLIAAAEYKRPVPDALKIVGFDDIMLSGMVNPPLTTVRQDVTAIAGKAVEALIQIIDEEEVERCRYIVPVELIRRKTT